MTKTKRQELKDALRVIEDSVGFLTTDDLVPIRRALDEALRKVDNRILSDAGKGGSY